MPIALSKLFTFCLLSFFYVLSVDANQNHDLENLRKNYLKARELLDKGNFLEYQQIKPLLATYPLLPYLEYQEIAKTLFNKPYKRIDQFLDRNQNTYVGNLLLRKWLFHLASDERWYDFRSYYTTDLSSSALKCYSLWARIQTGDNKAINETETLWNVAKSQPRVCDPLFKEWLNSGYLTQDILWQRFVKASLKGNSGLTRYLKTKMSKKHKGLALLLQNTLKNPSLVENKLAYKNNHSYKSFIVYNGLKRYVRNNSENAPRLWQHYSKEYSFTPRQKASFFYSLARRNAFDGKPEISKKYLTSINPEQKITIIEISIRHYLESKNWREVDSWIALLPKEEQLSDRWQYWQARTYESLGKSRETYLPIYTSLAKNRSFFGFLSADYLGVDYALQSSPTIVEQTTINYLKKMPAIQRARELFFLDKMNEARQEWKYALYRSEDSFTPERYKSAAKVAYSWGWYRKSIESMAAAKSWDDLRIRFPLAHADIINYQAKKSNIPANLLFAIARQESAWESDAKSSAGAMGLMQIMPKTAIETAKKAGIPHKRQDLYKPEHNIALGSRYISELLSDFDNNRLPAIAAYNAGPHRVSRWLEKSDSKLPYDIWIEVIPFGETRKYVQNVLTYSLLYGHKTGSSNTLLTQLELERAL